LPIHCSCGHERARRTAIPRELDGPIFPNLARHRKVDGANQLWVADITYIAIAAGFVYLAAILDAWSPRVVGYAISRSMMRAWKPSEL
jgi:transposase InsO family protein